MPDTYPDFATLAAREREGVDFRVVVRTRDSRAAIVAPHGGGIEPGTSEIAAAIAGPDHSAYAFEGIKRTGNAVLHITGSRFDEPRCLELLASADRVVTIHGEDSEEPIVFLGGRDAALGEALARALRAGRFEVRSQPRLPGIESSNICNRGRSSVGVQLELSLGLRTSFFASLRAAGRRFPSPRLGEFAAAVRDALR